MKEPLHIAKALADPTRLRILCTLRGRDLCVCQLIELLQLAPSTVSKHLSILKNAGLAESRKEGRWMHYRIAEEADASPAAGAALEWVWAHVSNSAEARSDSAAIAKILRIPKEILCQQQTENSACCSSAPATPAAARWQKAGRAN